MAIIRRLFAPREISVLTGSPSLDAAILERRRAQREAHHERFARWSR